MTEPLEDKVKEKTFIGLLDIKEKISTFYGSFDLNHKAHIHFI